MSRKSVIIVGAGVSGLVAALELHQQGFDCQILERSSRPGGRVKTDFMDGYALDHGFQVLLTAYPECKRYLDYESLRLGAFRPGALVASEGRFYLFEDPFRAAAGALKTALNPLGSVRDKWNVLQWRRRVGSRSLTEIFRQPEKSARQALQDYGFSERFIERFCEPFFGGIFLERKLSTSRRMLDFVFKMFSEGLAALPEGGMEQIPRQLAARLPAGTIQYQQSVVQVTDNSVLTEDGELHEADAVLLATEATSLAAQYVTAPHTRYHSVKCFYYAASQSPLSKPLLVLNGHRGAINNLAVLSDAAAGYAPPNQSLISVTVTEPGRFPGERAIREQVQKELHQLMGPVTRKWEHLETYHISYALPEQTSVRLDAPEDAYRLSRSLFVCGDHLLHGSLNAAMRSGRMAAEKIMESIMVGTFQ